MEGYVCTPIWTHEIATARTTAFFKYALSAITCGSVLQPCDNANIYTRYKYDTKGHGYLVQENAFINSQDPKWVHCRQRASIDFRIIRVLGVPELGRLEQTVATEV